MLPDGFENLRNMCLAKYQLDLAKSFLAPLLAWQAGLKETKLKLVQLISMLLMVKKGTRVGTCHSS